MNQSYLLYHQNDFIGRIYADRVEESEDTISFRRLSDRNNGWVTVALFNKESGMGYRREK